MISRHKSTNVSWVHPFRWHPPTSPGKIQKTSAFESRFVQCDHRDSILRCSSGRCGQRLTQVGSVQLTQMRTSTLSPNSCAWSITHCIVFAYSSYLLPSSAPRACDEKSVGESQNSK